MDCIRCINNRGRIGVKVKPKISIVILISVLLSVMDYLSRLYKLFIPTLQTIYSNFTDYPFIL